MGQGVCDRCRRSADLRVVRATCPAVDKADLPPFRSFAARMDGYALRLCRLCRAQWMSMTQAWWADRCPDRPPMRDCVVMLVNGEVVEMTPNEALEYLREREAMSG